MTAEHRHRCDAAGQLAGDDIAYHIGDTFICFDTISPSRQWARILSMLRSSEGARRIALRTLLRCDQMDGPYNGDGVTMWEWCGTCAACVLLDCLDREDGR